MVFHIEIQVIISVLLFFVMYPLGGCKSLASQKNNTTVSDNGSVNAQDKDAMIKKLESIVDLKARAHTFKECNTTKNKVLTEIVKRYKKILKNMSKNGVKKTSRVRVKDLVLERHISKGLTVSPTNKRTQQISFKNGQFLSMDSNGDVTGSSVTSWNKNNTIFCVKTTSPHLIMIQSVHTKKYVAMDKHGHIYSKTIPDHDTLFYRRTEENNFLTLASYKYYLLCPYDMFLAIRNSGNIRSPHQSIPGQDSTQLIFVPVK